MFSFTTGEDDDLEHPTQEQKGRCMTTTGFEFHRGLKNSMTTFQEAVRQSATTNSIDDLARPPIGTPSMTTRSFRLVLSEIRTIKLKESAWSSVVIGKRSIPSANTQRSTSPRQ
jgi:hypothetical protein